MKYISIERIRIEFNKFLQGNYFTDQAYLLSKSELADFLPGFTNDLAERVMILLAEDFEGIKLSDRDERLMWALMLKHMNLPSIEDARKLLRQWTHSNTFNYDVVEMMEIIELYKSNSINSIEVYQHKLELLKIVETYLYNKGLLKQKNIEHIYRQLPIKSRNELSVNGKEMIDILGLNKGGPLVGQWIEKIELLVVNNELDNNYESIKNYIQHSIELN
ncbi:hypothetical protein ACF3NG_05135 [Aerococcaceae bacterium WGS1372]